MVAEYKRIDRLRTVVKLVDQGLCEIVLERAFGTARSGDTDASQPLVILNIVGAEEQVIPAVLLYHRRRPQCALGPAHVVHIQNTRVLLPGHQVFRGKRIHEDLFAVGR